MSDKPSKAKGKTSSVKVDEISKTVKSTKKSTTSSVTKSRKTPTKTTEKSSRIVSKTSVKTLDANKSLDVKQKKVTATPKRKIQQAKNLRPIVGGVIDKKTLSKEERNKIKIERNAQAAIHRKREQDAFVTGNQKYLPLKDQGDVKRFARELVDEKTTPLEFFIFIAMVLLLGSILTQQIGMPIVTLSIMVLTYAYIFISLIFAIFRIRKIKAEIISKYGDKKTVKAGLNSYIFYRMTQPKKLRLPKVGV